MKYLAHITSADGQRIDQSLKEHCRTTAAYAEEALVGAGLGKTAYLAGLLHDMGKATKAFNDYLEKAWQGESVERGSVNHTFSGVIYLFKKYHRKEAGVAQILACEIISYSIGAHHGLFDCKGLGGDDGFLHRTEYDRGIIYYEEALENFFREVAAEDEIETLFEASVQEISVLQDTLNKDCFGRGTEKPSDARKLYFAQLAFLTRMVLSSLIYADRRDTSEFMKQTGTAKADLPDWETDLEFYHEKIRSFSPDSPMNCVRAEISEQCLNAADRKAGVYRLNVPTGGGKTLACLRYALAHAHKYQKRKILFVIPLLSVLEQNAQVIKNYLPERERVLEHHSNVILPESDGDELDQYETAVQRWDTGVIITTLFQLLETLMSGRTSCIGRMQALADSVVVIDEVQTLPKKTLLMFNAAVNYLSSCCGTTFILTTATQPCLERTKWPMRYAEDAEIVHLTQAQLKVFQRADFINNSRSPFSLEELAEYCRLLSEKKKTLLVICNTKSEAREIYRLLYEKMADCRAAIFHLSTAMCKEHRSTVLKKVQSKLKTIQGNIQQGRACEGMILVSTQLVEAGVDFSFQCVLRVSAGIDNIAQAAGRCNRSGEYPEGSEIHLVRIKNESKYLRMLKEITKAQRAAESTLSRIEHRGGTPFDAEASSLYYRYLFDDLGETLKYPVKGIGNLADLLGNSLLSRTSVNCLQQPFKTIGKLFEVFDEWTQDVIVPYGQGANIIYEMEKLDQKRIYGAEDWRLLERLTTEAGGYMVSLGQYQIEKLEEAGMLRRLFDGRVICLDKAAYEDGYGVADPSVTNVDNFIF